MTDLSLLHGGRATSESHGRLIFRVFKKSFAVNPLKGQ